MRWTVHAIGAVTAADSRAQNVQVKRATNGLSSGWQINYVISDGEVVSAGQLSAVLLAARDSGETEPGQIILTVRSESGGLIELKAPSELLGLSTKSILDAIRVSRSSIDTNLGPAK